uniref:Uncharacterized protein n=2 Tax=Cacopsylla melanoneura TaxID=428564 RepID=A0A8D8Z3S6_9HEMI
MKSSSVCLFLVCLCVCLLYEAKADMKQVYFKTKNIKNNNASVESAEKLSADLQDADSGKLKSREGGYLLSGGISALGALLFLKVKAVLFVIAAILIIGVLTKLVGGYGIMCGVGGPCDGAPFASSGHGGGSTPPFHPSYKDGDSYFPSGGGGDEYYRRAMDTFDLGFLAKLMKSVDFVDMTFNVLNLEEESCRKKMVCEIDNTVAAGQNPILTYLMDSVRVNLDKYRSTASHNMNATVKQDCDFLHPECKRSLNPADMMHWFRM